jgi:hypothetical protein
MSQCTRSLQFKLTVPADAVAAVGQYRDWLGHRQALRLQNRAEPPSGLLILAPDQAKGAIIATCGQHHTRYRHCSGSQLLLSSTVSRRFPGRKGPLRPDWSRCTHTPPFLTSTQTNGVSVRLPPPPDMLSTGDHRHDDAYLRFTPSRGCQPGRRYRSEFGTGQKVGIWRRSRSRCLTRPPRL